MQLIDTNIIIYYLDGKPNVLDFFKQFQGQMAISMITVAEVLSYPYDEIERVKVERFLKNRFIWVEVTERAFFRKCVTAVWVKDKVQHDHRIQS